MKITVINLGKTIQNEIWPKTTVKIIRKDKLVTNKTNETEVKKDDAKDTIKNDLPTNREAKTETETEYRQNELNIQMLSKTLFNQIFNGNLMKKELKSDVIDRCIQDFKQHGINPDESPRIPDALLKLPPFRGKNINEHFYEIAKEQLSPYRHLIDSFLNQKIPSFPPAWSFTSGWTHYDQSGRMHSVEYPSEDALIFDIEVCMEEGKAPTMACALGKQGWYSWTSPTLIDLKSSNDSNKQYIEDCLIPLESSDRTIQKQPKIVIGHNVSFDRARVREQYWLEGTPTRFLDTMSLHVCVSGLTSYQRALLKSNKELSDEDHSWSNVSSLNSLAEVYKLYCGQELDKVKRDFFTDGSLSDIRENFQNLMSYCAGDVSATFQVFCELFPLFSKRFPHPATLAGMLEIGMAYLPVNSNWNRYINQANLAYEDLNIEAKYFLEKSANHACRLMHNAAYKKDLWMWDQDWSVQELKFKKQVSKNVKASTENVFEDECSNLTAIETKQLNDLHEKFSNLVAMKNLLPVRRPLLPGYPEWYRKLCEKPTIGPEWKPGPCNISTGMQVVPKLLSLCWEGYPLHYIRGQGWGFLIPHKSDYEEGENGSVPIIQLAAKCPILGLNPHEASLTESEMAFSSLSKSVEENISKKDYYRKKKQDKTHGRYTGTGVWCNTELDNCCWFFKLPHKNGVSHRVGNPLARDFLNKFSENVLSGDGAAAEKVIHITRMMSYWRNNRDRITDQMVVWSKDREIGAIIPQVVVCGTLTRRAMEPTWMTASNAQTERIGSELRAMVQAPPGYRIVGADVDSQELWIASMLGDASAIGAHGATPLGWMTLSGNKADGSDMHSVTAKAVGISRDHAKVINYARIYGAGQNFAERLLKQFNPTMSDGEAKSKAIKMFAMTKGKKVYELKDEFKEMFVNKSYSVYEAMKIAAAHGHPIQEMFLKAKWIGGSESAMFNRLEEIAEMQHPMTPFLNCRLSRALEPTSDNEDRFLPTRVNWVVQSGAVDFLHLMLVCMRWLMGNKARFCLSFHDEVRYLVPETHAYQAALAMHVTNLLTRSFCAHRVGLNDLPQSVAFFSSVEIDRVLRKDASMDCRTPSNPHGMSGGYGIPPGESLDIYKTIEKANTNDLSEIKR